MTYLTDEERLKWFARYVTSLWADEDGCYMVWYDPQGNRHSTRYFLADNMISNWRNCIDAAYAEFDKATKPKREDK